MSKSPHLWGNIGTIQPWRHKLLELKEEKKNMTLESWCSPPSAAIRKILRVSAGGDSINRVIKANVEGFSFSTTKKKSSSNHIIFITCPFDELLLSLQNSKKFAKYMMSFFDEFFGKTSPLRWELTMFFFCLQILPYVNQIK